MTTQAPTNANNIAGPHSNVPEMTVSELSFSVKKTLEDSFGHVRVRGELSRVKVVGSGHMYSDLKDDKAVLNLVCWRGVLGKLSVQPEEGLEVIVTGRISSYPQRSNYQLIVESMELAGEGALLKMLEMRKKQLAAEGLFAPERKQKLPFLPQKIGVITSPTGAVIRDIMHRLNDRFPRHVLLWPVRVQGETAAAEITTAIEGFDKLPPEHKPDLLIVARGGGSLEDLMAFNEENVVRAVAACSIPVISAVGHETDTTLIDYAADVRAPTPTGAAEMAVPRRMDLLTRVDDNAARLRATLDRQLGEVRTRLESLSGRMLHPERLLETKMQMLDHVTHKMKAGFERSLSQRQNRLSGMVLRHPQGLIEEKARHLDFVRTRLTALPGTLLKDRTQKLHTAGRMLETLSFKSILNRGFVVVRDKHGQPVTAAANTKAGQGVSLEFKDGSADAVISGKKKSGSRKDKTPPENEGPDNKSKGKDQASLF